MKKLFTLILFLSSSAFAAVTVNCNAGDIRINLTQAKPTAAIIVTIDGKETAEADGIISAFEVDIVARLPNSGEMTLFAKVAKNSMENYLFYRGKHYQVNCR